MTLPPLSLYVHLPWCVQKCPYCDFNSHSAGRDAPKARYIDALQSDLVNESSRAADRPLISVFLGGGTPSLFSPEQIGKLLETVQNEFELADDVEITMEANPGTVECGDPAAYREAGVNRLSIGAQSFSPAMLDVLGRIHSVADIERAVDGARAGGFENFNLDLMYALPGQDVAAAVADLDAAIRLQPPHLSWYQLTLEPNTVFYARPPDGLPDNDLCADIQLAGQAALEAAGYARYEVSAWARGPARCRHNLNYWTFGDYLAAGAGAHGKITGPGGVLRYTKPAHPLAYLTAIESGAGSSPAAITGPELAFEFMLNVLRLDEGFTTALFTERTGLDLDCIETPLGRLAEKRLIDADSAGHWRPTALGQRFLNELQAEFLP